MLVQFAHIVCDLLLSATNRGIFYFDIFLKKILNKKEVVFMRVPSEKKIKIGKKIKQLRKNKGMTQEELELKVDISRSTISNYETGRRTPHLQDLQKIAAAFGVGLEYFDMSVKDEAFDLISRAKEVFASPNIDEKTKEELYLEFMKLYLSVKGDN